MIGALPHTRPLSAGGVLRGGTESAAAHLPWAAWQMEIQPPHSKQALRTHHLWGKPTRPTGSTGLFISSSTASASPHRPVASPSRQLALRAPELPAQTSTTCSSSAGFPTTRALVRWQHLLAQAPRRSSTAGAEPPGDSHTREHSPAQRGEAGEWAAPGSLSTPRGKHPPCRTACCGTAGPQRTHQTGPSCSQSGSLGAGERECPWLFGSGC